MAFNSKKIVVTGACVVALACAGYAGFIYFQGKKVDEIVKNINTQLDSNELMFKGEILSSSFTERNIEISAYLKNVEDPTEAIAVFEGPVKLGFSPKALIHLKKTSLLDEDNLILKSMKPKTEWDFDFRFNPKKAVFSSESFSLTTDGNEVKVGSILGTTTFSGAENSFKRLVNFDTTIKISPMSIINKREFLKLGSQEIKISSNGASSQPIAFKYDVKDIGANLNSTFGRVNSSDFSFDTGVTKNGDIFSQTTSIELNNFSYKGFLPVNVPDAKITAKLNWNKSVSPYSALFYDEYGDEFCKENKEVCSENAPFFGNIGASSEELKNSILNGQVSFDLLPSRINASDFIISGEGSVKFTPGSNKIGSFKLSLTAENDKKLSHYSFLLPRNGYSINGNTATSDITLEINNGRLEVFANGQKQSSSPFNLD